MTTGPAAPLRSALDLAVAAVAAVDDDHWSAPTPCARWDVRAVVDHLHQGNLACAAALARPAEADDLAGSSAALVAAFSAPGALERPVTLPVGQVPGAVALHLRTVEALVHGWDVAVATGQPFPAPDDLVTEQLAFSEAALAMLPPERTPFGPAVAVPDDAPVLARLVGLLGRDPTAGAACPPERGRTEPVATHRLASATRGRRAPRPRGHPAPAPGAPRRRGTSGLSGSGRRWALTLRQPG